MGSARQLLSVAEEFEFIGETVKKLLRCSFGETMRYLSVCSGIEAASVAWHPLGWEPAAFSEIEPFPCSVLEHRFPGVPNLGDMTKFEEWDIEPGSIDVLVGGTPCQSFSIAGLRGGLEDGRGNLALIYCRILQKFKPRWFVWENVPGVLSSNGGRDFGSILGAMAELGYSFAWRVLDAQHFGVPQRRRRVFVVGHLGNWRRAAGVLFESGCVSGNTAKSRKQKQDIAAGTEAGTGVSAIAFQSSQSGERISNTHATIDANFGARRRCGVITASTGNVSHCLNAGGMGRQDYETETMVVAFSSKNYAADAGETSPTLRAMGHSGSHANAGGQVAISGQMGVRRLTPRECERLQGFPDDWTLVLHRGKPAANGPRYKAIGNSMAVPVMRWIGSRISEQVQK